jgi:membrane glycosyltransferase
VLGATARLRYAKRNPDATDWQAKLFARRPFKVAAMVVASKMARIAWALLAAAAPVLVSVWLLAYASVLRAVGRTNCGQ